MAYSSRIIRDTWLGVLDAFVEAEVQVRGIARAIRATMALCASWSIIPKRRNKYWPIWACAVVTKEVLCLRLPDRPGELANIMGVFARLNINVEYSYSLVSTYIAISVKDLAAAEEALKEEAVELIDQAQLTALVDLDRSNAQEGR